MKSFRTAHPSRSRTFIFLLAIASSFLFTCTSAPKAFSEDWPKYKKDLANSGHSSETGINSSNVAMLKSKWTFATNDKISASPAVATIKGTSMLFLGADNGVFYALNAVTGAQIWSFTVDLIGNCSPKGGCRIGSSAAVDTSANLVFFGARNAYLYALNATTGQLVWKQSVGDSTVGYEIWSSPAVYKGNVYVGVASHGDDPCIPGQVRAFNELTGANTWAFNTIDQRTCPGGGVCVGAPVWSSVAIDSGSGIVYAGTGNPGTTCNPPTQNFGLYPDSILAINASTGALLNYYQAIKNDNNDKDFGSSPFLHTASETNQCTNTKTTTYWVSNASKNGHLYTAQRNAHGLTGQVYDNVGNQWGYIATPAVRNVEVTTSCGQGKNIIDSVNYIYAPSVTGPLDLYYQDGTGKAGLQTKVKVSTNALFGAPASIQDVVLYGGTDGNLYASAQYGKVLATFPIGPTIWGGVAISNGRVYFGDTGGVIHCLSINAK